MSLVGESDDNDAEIRRLKAELRDLKEDHDIVKKAAVFYNRQRRHSFSDRVPAMMFEAKAIAA